MTEARARMPLNPMSAQGPEDDEIDLREIFDLLKAGRWAIGTCVIVALVIGIFYVVFTRPVYSVSGTVQVDESSTGASSLASSLGSLSGLLSGATLQTQAEMQIMQSRLVLDPVIDKLGLLVSAKPRYFPLIGRKIAAWHRNASKPVGAPPLLGSYAWGGEQIEVDSFVPSSAVFGQPYTLTVTADGYTLTDPDGNHVLDGKVGQLEQGQSPDGVVKIKVGQLVGRVGEQFSVVHHARQMVLQNLQSNLSISEQGKQSGIISLSYSGPDKLQDLAIINAVENAYMAQNIARNSQQAQRSLQFLEKQLPSLRKKMDQAQLALANYQKKHGAANVATETQLLLKQSVALKTQISSLVQQRDQALQRFTARHPVVIGLDRQINTLKREQDKLEQKIGKLPSTQQQVLGLMRDLDVNSQLYTTILNAIQQFQVSKAGTVGDVRIVDYGMLPLKPIKPKKGLVLVLAVVLGGFLGIAWVFLRRVMLRGVDDPAELEERLNISVLASVPYSSRQRGLSRRMQRNGGAKALLANTKEFDTAMEAIRSLRTALQLSMDGVENNILMFAGPAPGVGKSFVSVNYAALLAASGKRVVLVDADLRKGHLQRYLGLQSHPGLGDWLSANQPLSIDAIVQHSQIQNLDMVARGRHSTDPAEQLLSDRFRSLIEQLSSRYDVVIVDTPPVLAVTDASIVGKLAGTTLLVLKAAEHPLREIEESIKRLAAAGVRVKGFVMNQVGAKAGSYGYGGYGYNYHEYGSTEPDAN